MIRLTEPGRPIVPGSVLAQLAQPQQYRACASDLLIDAHARSSWLALFRTQGSALLRTAEAAGYDAAQCRSALAALHRALDAIEEDPARHGRLDILLLDELRDGILRGNGIDDAYRDVKARENASALAALPARAALLAVESDDAARLAILLRGVLEGNLFDMGALLTAGHYEAGHDLGAHVASAAPAPRVPTRPWRYDDVAALAAHLAHAPPEHVVIFADNSGADAVLGVLPLAHELLQAGARVTLAANERPSLNDVTAAELAALRDPAVESLPELSSPRLTVRSTGSGAPLIDLTALDPAFVEATADADMLVLIGMGRALESNWHIPFLVPALRIAMVKDPEVARTVDADVLDAVCRFTSPGESGWRSHTASAAPAAQR